jgi:hypothetical protein
VPGYDRYWNPTFLKKSSDESESEQEDTRKEERRADVKKRKEKL